MRSAASKAAAMISAICGSLLIYLSGYDILIVALSKRQAVSPPRRAFFALLSYIEGRAANDLCGIISILLGNHRYCHNLFADRQKEIAATRQ